MIDSFLNKITTYQLILYYLMALLAFGILFCGLGWVPVNPISVLETTAALLVVSLATNWAFSEAFRVTANQESTIITALILALVLGPASVETEPVRFGLICLAGVIAVASKYLLVWKRHHVFNPVALGIFVSGLVFHEFASWWIGQEALLPLVVAGGLLLARKTNRLRFVGLFAAIFSVLLLAWSLVQGLPLDQVGQNFSFVFLQSEIPFFAFAMLTEPITSPKRFPAQVVYLAVAALLALPQLSVFGLSFSPELALLVANLAAFALGPRGRHTLMLKEKRLIAKDTLAFVFDSPKGLNYQPGQYLELTLPLKKADSRGNRRYLSFASSPTETEVMVAARFPEAPSAFKRRWMSMEPGQSLSAAEVSGDFTLPRGTGKLAFIAGGIGVTPFRSMVKFLVDEKQPRDLVVIDSHSCAEHRVFDEVFDAARQVLGAKIVSTVTGTLPAGTAWKGERGAVDAEFLKRHVSGLHERTFFVSGSPSFVVHVERALRSLKISPWRIRTDFFPGY